MSDHFEPGVRKHYVSRESRSSKQDKQQEVKRKNDQSNDLDRRIAVPVRKCVDQGRCTTSAHDHCMPGPGKIPVGHQSGGYHGHAVARTVYILSMIYAEVPSSYWRVLNTDQISALKEGEILARPQGMTYSSLQFIYDILDSYHRWILVRASSKPAVQFK